MKRIFIAILIVITTITSTGCWDRVELEEIAFVEAMGFDKGPPGYLMTTFEVGVTGALAGAAQGGPQGPKQITTSVVSRTALEAIGLASLSLGRRLTLQHTTLYLFGEEIARSDVRFIAQAMDRFLEVRSTAFVAVARGRAEDVLRISTSPVETSPGRFVHVLMQQHGATGLFEATPVGRFFTDMSIEAENPTCAIIAPVKEFKPQSGQQQQSGSGGSQQAEGQLKPTPKVGERISPPVIPPALAGKEGNVTDLSAGQVPRIGGGPVEILGTAVFKGGKMVGELTGEETRAMIMAKGDFEDGAFAVPDPLVPDQPVYFLGAMLSAGKRNIKVKRTNEMVEVDLYLSLDMGYLSIKSQTDYTDPRNAPLAEAAFADLIKRRLDTAILRCQREMKSDVFGFGEAVKETFLTWPEWETFAWQSKFPNAVVRTHVQVHLRHSGRDFAPFNVPPGERL